MIDKDLLYENNMIIIDFLELKLVSNPGDDPIYKLIMDRDGIEYERNFHINEFMFHCDWNWFLWLWDHLHRKVIVPMVKDNPHLRRQINEQIKDMKSCLKWVRLEAAYFTLIKLIKYYNDQFDYRTT